MASMISKNLKKLWLKRMVKLRKKSLSKEKLTTAVCSTEIVISRKITIKSGIKMKVKKMNLRNLLATLKDQKVKVKKNKRQLKMMSKKKITFDI